MPEPNPQAVEAARVAYRKCRGGNQQAMEAAVQAAEPHIRSQLLTELAERFERWANEARRLRDSLKGDGRKIAAACLVERERAANTCRELAAKEESE